MRTMIVSKNIAVMNVMVLCLFMSFFDATEQSASKVTPLSLKSETGKEVGPHGKCELDKEGKLQCVCDPGFKLKNGVCEECDCGSFGYCFFNQSVKQCVCKYTYGDKDGMCTKCTCSLPDDQKTIVPCTFENGVEKCKCPKGYEEENTRCVDINECLDPTSCHNGTRCENYEGYYMCFCKEGYTGINGDAKTYGCRDIDECVEHGACSRSETTTCVNTDGSFYCECKPGYSSSDSQATIMIFGCDRSGLGIGYIVLIVVAVLFLVGVVAFAVKKRFYS